MKRIFSILFLLFPFILSAQCLSGVYTIGGTTPNYTTINSAVSALTTNGVCGPVTFNIRSGTYLQRVVITPFSGSSPVNTVTFQSEALDSSLVTIAETSISSANYVVWLNGADNIIFRKLSIQNNVSGTTSYQTTFLMSNNADNITIENCSMYCIPSTNYNVINGSFALIYCPNSAMGDSITIRNNRLTGDNSAVSLYNSNPPYPVRHIVRDNIISGQYTFGVRIGYASQISVMRNSISGVAVPFLTYQAMTVATIDSAIVRENTISGPGGGITLLGLNPSNIGLISNNVINNNSTACQAQGISVQNVTANIYHNTVRVSNTTCGSTNVFISNASTTAIVKNNILQSIGPNASYGSIYIDQAPLSVYIGEGNVFDCGSTAVARWRPTISINYYYTNLAAWNIASNQDHLSSSALAQFVSSSDSHIASDFSQNATAGVVGGITTDIEGNLRSLSAPYPGAYEAVRLNGNDADAQLVRANRMNCPGLQAVNVNVKNRGLSSLTNFQINWSLNNILQTPYSWTGSLASMDTVLVPVGTFTGVNASRYIIKAWTSLPNSTTDIFPANDSTVVDTTWTGMSGSYTVGGVSPDFTTITQGINTLKTNGICGPVTFLLRNGTYTEQVIIDSIYGMSASNTLRLTSQSGDSTQVIWQYTSTNLNFNYVLRLSNAGWVTVDHLTLKQLGTPFNCAVLIENKSHDNLFLSIIFNANSTASTFANGSLVYSPNTNEKNIRFQKSSFTGGLVGINFINGAVLEKGMEVSECHFINQTSEVITFLSTSKIIIHKNLISTNATGYGINLGSADSCRVSDNILDGLFLRGIMISGIAGGNFQQMFIYNNAVNIRNNTGAQFGIYISCQQIKVEFNTVRLTAPNSTALCLTNSNNALVSSNVLYVQGTNGVAMNLSGTPIAGFTENYNAFYVSSGLKLIYQSTTYTTINSWNVATGFSQNSIISNPVFLNPNDCHAHQIALRDHGYFNPLITTDMDGDIRSNPPDIGADENNSVYTDAEALRIVLPVVLCAGSTPVPVVIRNQGTTALTQLTINWTVNAVSQTAVNWTGSLASGDSVQVNLGTVLFASAGSYLIQAITSMPNAITDPFPVNDTARYSLTGTTLNGTYTVGGVTPDYATFSAAVTALNTRGVCGPVTMVIRNGTYSGQTVLNSIAGASSTNRIRFVSSSGDSSLVTIAAVGNSAANYVINLSGASYVSFSKMTFSSSSSTYGSVMGVTGNCNSDSLFHCVLIAPSAATTANLFYESGSGIKTNFDITGNRFQNGQYGIKWNSAGVDTNFVFRKNVIQCLTNGLNTINEVYGLTFSENNVVVGAAYFVSLAGELKVQKNQINKLLRFDFCAATTSQRIVSNNYVAGSNGSTLLFNQCFGFRVLNNTFRGAGSVAAITLTTTYNIQFLNNIVENTTGNLISANSAPSFDSCNYNNWYNSGTFGTYGPTSYPNFSAWTSSTTHDQNSLNVNSVFISPTDYHIQVTSPLIQNAISLTSVPDDIDGDSRGLNSDIGADEATLAQVEAALQSFALANCINGPAPVSVNLTNNGTLNLTSATLNWKVDQTIQPPFSWTGNILPGQTLNNIIAGIYPFVVGQSYQVKVWVSNPNSQVDPNPANDTVVTTVVPHYNGTYTVGGISPDFSDPRTAISALQNYGVCGPVILNIRDGLYQDSLLIHPIPGSSAVNTITLTAESGDSSAVILESYVFNGNPGIFVYLFDSTSNITFRKLTFRSGVALSSEHITCTTNHHNITIENCVFRGVHGNPPPNANGISAFIYAPVYFSGSTNFIIRNNTFIDGQSGITIDFVTGLYITNNTFYQQWASGLSCMATDSFRVIGNTVEDSGNNPGFIGISAGLHILSTMASDSVIIAENKVIVHNGITGMSVFGGNALATYVMTVRNNVVSLNSDSPSAYGMKVSSDRTSVIHNTVKMTGTNCSAAFYANMSGSTVTNNSFVNYASTGAACYYMLMSFLPRNYNNYYSSSSELGRINGTPYANFAAFQAAMPTEDLNSNSGNPDLFNTPFWHPGSTALLNAGTPLITLAAFDIEGNPRSATTPDIGAYEYTPGNDLGIYAINSASLNCAGTHVVEVSVRNHGGSTVSAFTLNWTVNGIPQSNLNWTGTLLPGDSIVALTVGSFSSAAGTATVIVNMQLAGDINPLNDTIQNDRRSGPLSGDYTVGGNAPDFILLDDAFTLLEANGVCGAVRLLVRDGFYYEHAHLSQLALTATNNLTILSENNDSSLVTFYHVYHTNLTTPVVRIDSTEYVTFHSIGFNNGASSGSTATTTLTTLFIENCNNISVNHSQFSSNLPYFFPTSRGLIQCYLTDQLHLDSNYIGTQMTSVIIAGGQTDTLEYIFMNGNTIHGILDLSYIKNTTLEHNQLEALSITNSGDSIFVLKNRITNDFYMYQVFGTAAGRNMIWDNFIETSTRGEDLQYTDFIYNNFQFRNTSYYNPNNRYALELTYGDNCKVINNNIVGSFYVNGPSARFGIISPLTNTTINYNNYWCNSQTSFIAAQQGNGYDLNSITIDPQYVSPSSDLHVQNSALVGTALPFAGIADDYDGDIRSLIAPSIGADDSGAVMPHLSMVWPGNANKDSIVDNNDLLPIGIFMGQSGLTRSSISNAWQGFPSYDWGIAQANGRDLKFADSDGNGTIAVADTTAIGLNYGQVDLSPALAPNNSITVQSLVPLHFFTSSLVYSPGDFIDVYVWAGDTLQPVNQLYGASFKIDFTQGVMNANTTLFNYPASWLCTTGIDGLSFQKIFESQGRADGAVVRDDHFSRTGYGAIAILRFQADSTITQSTPVNFSFLDYRLIDSLGNSIPVAASTHSITIVPLVTTVVDPLSELQCTIFPNPVSDQLNIGLNLQESGVVSLDVIDMLGQTVILKSETVQKSGDQLFILNLGDLSNGNYLLRVRTAKGVVNKRIAVNH